ncbi:MAG: hypothetical protein Q8K05_10815 [Polaromonas sp.]|nr:hypothetical protein [Polaromonas sp.]MDP2256527.1 hypothetical protein [Polaromonas sp.]
MNAKNGSVIEGCSAVSRRALTNTFVMTICIEHNAKSMPCNPS